MHSTNTITNANQNRQIRLFSILEFGLIFLFAIIPLFSSFPYRVNIFLSWEGAYRLSQGEMPYKDFGMPLGYMYWVVPGIFFKIFGAKMITLIKAQVFLNILSGLAFRSILKSVSIQPGLRLISVVVYCISFTFFNFWPWYNHTVIVYQMVGLAFLLKYIFAPETYKFRWGLLALSALFIFFSFFTKQDGGALALLLSFSLLAYYSIHHKKIIPLAVFTIIFIVIAFLCIYPFTKYNFGYWFNHGQPPHTARVSTFEILDEFFYNSQWIKFYLIVIVLLAFLHFKKWKDLLADKKQAIFLILTLGILAEAAILQITSYTPPNNNIYFHSFAFAFILSMLTDKLNVRVTSFKIVAGISLCVLLWWSGNFWKYFQKITNRIFPSEKIVNEPGGENIVNRKTYMLELDTDTTYIPMSQWVYSGLKSFDKIYMPKPTVDGMHRVLNMDIVKKSGNLKVLNMTELTPLAAEMKYQLEKGPEIPLWYHLGVAMFNKEAKDYETKIRNHHYDLVLFEHIPNLNNFYPFRVRDTLLNNYKLIDSFIAPRGRDTKGMIEVFVKP